VGAGLSSIGEILASKPAGDVANAYEQSRAPVAAIIGPTGAGKTIASCRKIMRVAQWQDPSPKDGIRRARITCVGRTYRDVWDKPLKSYKKVFPEHIFGKVLGGKDNPADHHWRVRMPGANPDGTPRILDVEVQFRAIRDADLEEFVKGFETTAWWLPEMNTLPRDLVAYASNRVPRYPEPEHRLAPELRGDQPPAYGGVFGDANVPDIDDWFYNEYWLPNRRPEHWHLFRQPSGFAPDAENMENLRKLHPRYYENLASNQPAWMNKKFIDVRPGFSRHGTPVHPDFDDQRHVRQGVKVDPSLPVVIGVDSGANTLMPAAVFMQRALDGQVRILTSFSPDSQTTMEELGAEIRRILQTKIRRCAGAVIIGDPALAQKSSLNGVPFALILQNEARVEVRLAPTNDPNTRRGALAKLLRTHGRLVIDEVEGVAVIKALAGGFKYKKRDAHNGGELKPEKNVHSHTGEAVEYGAMGVEGVEATESDMLGLNGSYGQGSEAPAVIL